MKKYVMITGGELFNKGAQAMTFSVITAIKKINPKIVCVLLSTKDYMERPKEEKEAYGFLILPYRIKEIIYGIGKETEITGILKNCNMMLDISGYVLSSDWGKRRCQSFLLKILIAKIYSIPVYVMPQSYGPLEFKGIDSFIIDRMIRFIMPYPEVIYAREKQGFQLLTEKYGLPNVKRSLDMVLLNDHIDSELIYKVVPEKRIVPILGNSVGIIPNQRTIEHGSKERILELYMDIIETLLSAGKNVYLLSHSKDDEGVCEEIKGKYVGDSRIIYLRQEFSCIEFEDIIKNFEYVIASRYHAVIHAYKRSVPCIILGWAVKYQEVAEIFGQDEYIFHISGEFSGKNVMRAIHKMNTSYEKEAEAIRKKLVTYRNGNIFGFLEQLGDEKR